MKLSVFILAAGLGERLRPITDYIPKPLLPILGKPILQSILEKVSTLPVHKIGINLHHKKELIENWIRQSAFNNKVELFSEDLILGTGGALKNAEVFLNERTFLVHNSDIVSDIDLGELLDYHLSSGNLVTLAVHNYPEFNKLEIDERGFFRRIGTDHPHPTPPPSTTFRYLAFTGIAVYSPDFLRLLPSGVSSVVDAWIKAIKAGYKVGTFDVSGCYWSDIGTPASYASTVINELRKNGEYVYVHPSIKTCKQIDMDGYVVAEEGVSFGKGVSLRNCIMLPGSIIETRKEYITPPIPPLPRGGKRGVFENCILGSGFKIDLSESEMFGLPGTSDTLLIGTGGSDRRYYRIKKKKNKEVLMQCSTNDPDFQRHIEYTRFFQKYSIPVPKLIHVETEKMSGMFEDLGDLSLYSYLKCPHEDEEIEEIYKRIIDILILMHMVMTEHITECTLLQNKIFDYEYLRWETSYFIERFIEGIMDIRVKNLSVLNDEFHRLAMKVDSFPKTVVHRDFQSQNIMITKGGIPRVVDYQGARIGPPAYDVVSLLWDPYYRLKDDLRERLLGFYIEKIKKSGIFFKEIDFNETLLPCRLQRHMQALGAYGFLSRVKGKKYFLKYVPEALRLLKEDVSLSKKEYPQIYNLVMRL
jgi:NDP-sugar pyrophosphorylase family protein